MLKEAIRLVIWDLDNTFWRGTLSEGGIQEYVKEHQNIVIELAKRGIISSICSKNDHLVVEKILLEYGIWDYFILPSINWDSKGPRLRELINNIQLRPETVLFIDDSAANRAEAAKHVPGLQISDESFIPTILNDAMFKGKDDPQLTRLKQYQLLQQRKLAVQAANTDNASFLRASNIHVAIDPNISTHLERAVELINRTNQLNFTKIRLPDDKLVAQKELMELVNRYFIQAGLVRVWDKYGDYGFCGLYIISSMHGSQNLVHFCFSCRILGMGVERWLFKKLGKPKIQITGEVQADIQNEEKIDWINQDLGDTILFFEGNETSILPNSEEILQFLVPEIRLKGGCELDALSHYLNQETSKLVTYTNYVNGAFLMRQDSTANIVLSLSQLDKQIENEIAMLGFNRKDFDEPFFVCSSPGTLFVLSTWGDLYLSVYRHNTLGFEIQIALRRPGIHELTKATSKDLEDYFIKSASSEENKEQIKRITQHLRTHYHSVNRMNHNMVHRNWVKIFERIPQDCLLVVLLPYSRREEETTWALQYHTIVRTLARDFPQVVLLDVTPYVNPHMKQQDARDHFDRMVYYNVYKDLIQEIGRRSSLNTKSDILIHN